MTKENERCIRAEIRLLKQTITPDQAYRALAQHRVLTHTDLSGPVPVINQMRWIEDGDEEV